MQKAFDLIVERLEELKSTFTGWKDDEFFFGKITAYDSAINIVNQVAEEYEQEVCEWIIDKDPLGTRYTACIGNDFIQDDPFDWEYCPYCGKKIKVIQPKGE